jgi:hypothetical protein
MLSSDLKCSERLSDFIHLLIVKSLPCTINLNKILLFEAEAWLVNRRIDEIKQTGAIIVNGYNIQKIMVHTKTRRT